MDYSTFHLTALSNVCASAAQNLLTLIILLGLPRRLNPGEVADHEE